MYAHSLTYFLFLSLKLGIFEEDLFKFIKNELYYNQSPMETESTINFLFSLSRIEKIVGQQGFQQQLDGQQLEIMRYFIREKLHKNMKGVEEYIYKERSQSSQIAKVTMIIKALTFNK